MNEQIKKTSREADIPPKTTAMVQLKRYGKRVRFAAAGPPATMLPLTKGLAPAYVCPRGKRGVTEAGKPAHRSGLGAYRGPSRLLPKNRRKLVTEDLKEKVRQWSVGCLCSG